MNVSSSKPLVLSMIFVFLWTVGMVGPALADLVGPHSDITTKANELSKWERQLVYQWLLDYGYSPEEAHQMLAGVSEEEIHEIILQAENMGLPYGAGALEAVVAILIILILIIILLRLLNKEIIIA